MESDILIMDVEGTESRERGDEQDFERRSALFSLAISEVIIVNLWEHQVGLYQGANMGLLKTVFEVNLGLFGKPAADGCVFTLVPPYSVIDGSFQDTSEDPLAFRHP